MACFCPTGRATSDRRPSGRPRSLGAGTASAGFGICFGNQIPARALRILDVQIALWSPRNQSARDGSDDGQVESPRRIMDSPFRRQRVKLSTLTLGVLGSVISGSMTMWLRASSVSTFRRSRFSTTPRPRLVHTIPHTCLTASPISCRTTQRRWGTDHAASRRH